MVLTTNNISNLSVPVVVKPETIVCPKCKQETGLKGVNLLDVTIVADIACSYCGSIVISCRPEPRPPFVYVVTNRYDYD